MLTIVPLIIIIISVGTILIVASRHIKKAAALDISQIPEEREATLKRSILENRLLRKVDHIFRFSHKLIGPAQRYAAKWLAAALGKIKNLERVYRFQGALPDSSKKAQEKLNQLIDEAQQAELDGSFGQAESKYLSAIKINPDFSDAYIGLGKAYMKMQEWDQSKETFEYVTSHWPQDDRAFASLGQLEQRRGNLEEAKGHFLHALSINNEIVDYHIELSEIYLRLGDNEKALSSLQKAQGLEPNNPKILDQLFLVSVLLSNKQLAKEVLEKIKSANPDHGRLGEFEKKVKDLK